MFLQPSEVGFLKHLKEARVPVVEFEFPTKRIVNVQSQLEKLIGQNYYLNKVIPAFAHVLSVKLSIANVDDTYSLQRMATALTSKHMPRIAYARYLMSTNLTWSKLPRASGSRHLRGLISRSGRV